MQILTKLSDKRANFVDKFLRYFVAGGGAAIVDLGLFQFQVAYGAPILVAAIISFCVAACCNYAISSLFVFNTKLNLVQLVKFFIFSLAGLCTNSLVTWLGVKGFYLYPIVAKIIGISLAFFVNFFVNYMVVFRG